MCEDTESLVDVLEDEIDYLTASFETQEFTFPRTAQTIAKFQDKPERVTKNAGTARRGLKGSRDANPLPTEEKLVEAQTA